MQLAIAGTRRLRCSGSGVGPDSLQLNTVTASAYRPQSAVVVESKCGSLIAQVRLQRVIGLASIEHRRGHVMPSQEASWSTSSSCSPSMTESVGTHRKTGPLLTRIRTTV